MNGAVPEPGETPTLPRRAALGHSRIAVEPHGEIVITADSRPALPFRIGSAVLALLLSLPLVVLGVFAEAVRNELDTGLKQIAVFSGVVGFIVAVVAMLLVAFGRGSIRTIRITPRDGRVAEDAARRATPSERREYRLDDIRISIAEVARGRGPRRMYVILWLTEPVLLRRCETRRGAERFVASLPDCLRERVRDHPSAFEFSNAARSQPKPQQTDPHLFP